MGINVNMVKKNLKNTDTRLNLLNILDSVELFWIFLKDPKDVGDKNTD